MKISLFILAFVLWASSLFADISNLGTDQKISNLSNTAKVTNLSTNETATVSYLLTEDRKVLNTESGDKLTTSGGD